MKTKLEIQYNNRNIMSTDIEKTVKEDLKVQGVKMNTIDTLNIYYQPSDGNIYYLAKLNDGKEIASDAIQIKK